MSNKEWIRQGRLHAVGRYQFIGMTLPGVVKRSGIPITAKFTPEVQDLLALQYLKEAGIGAWVGPADKATRQERAIIEAARKEPINYRPPVSTSSSPQPSQQQSQPSQQQSQPSQPIKGKTPGYSQAVAFGKSLLSKGYKNIWQHPDFNWSSGYTGSGKERVMQRGYNSYHNYGEALDISAFNGEAKLDALYAQLNKNRSKYGIAEILWRTRGHYDHMHIAFNKLGSTLSSSAITKPSTPAQISPAQQQSAMVPFSLTPERRGQDIMIIEPQQQQNI
ncbi:MAG: hypothetical protein EBT80_10205, partial [Chitinophagales bacterium]|nr:hypothetical protein [Chitinophagales bacterium]